MSGDTCGEGNLWGDLCVIVGKGRNVNDNFTEINKI